MKRLILLLGVLLIMAYTTTLTGNTANYADSPQQKEGKFRNPVAMNQMGLRKALSIWWKFAFDKPAGTVPTQAIPVQTITRAQLLAAPDNSLYRLGHSTVLLKLHGQFWLTDPVFSERASPVQWAGPARFHAPPIGIAELPPIRGVILSHDHYDHLDYAAIQQLADKVEVFLTPLGVGDRLIGWGVPAAKVRQLDWWQTTTVDGLRLSATPAQHFSGRTPFDGNKTLWASWVIDSGDLRIFFSGDSGYFKGFKEIGDKHGPFDLTLLETGAYDPQWPDVHMQPEETLQAHKDLRGKVLLPIHNGTFDLALHTWDDPFQRIAALAAEHGHTLATPQIGQALNIAAPAPTPAWWTAAK
ncbi:MBL fold metallo-hydrolase [Massilia sp. erpn]|uniref:MBL fold metallo-hydrolase n=1 Tax=Massilia sp. erpn TaxID=2738142 RepID=UPI0021FB949D|nr:hydrolase [Massilia sp. erpn]